jgi:hypothetical protein
MQKTNTVWPKGPLAFFKVFSVAKERTFWSSPLITALNIFGVKSLYRKRENRSFNSSRETVSIKIANLLSFAPDALVKPRRRRQLE